MVYPMGNFPLDTTVQVLFAEDAGRCTKIDISHESDVKNAISNNLASKFGFLKSLEETGFRFRTRRPEVGDDPPGKSQFVDRAYKKGRARPGDTLAAVGISLPRLRGFPAHLPARKE